MKRVFLVFALLAVALIAPAANAAPEKRVALVVGVSHYQNVPGLTNPANDARLVGTTLEKLDFDVQTLIDPDYETMKRGLRDFGLRVEGAKVALFYFAGHGLQVSGRNYLLPVDAALAREPDLRYETFDIQAVLDEMDAPGKIDLIFLDACRDDPFAQKLAGNLGNRSVTIGQGLAEVQTQTAGTLIAYATAPGTVARDGADRNSPFTAALVRHLPEPATDVRKILQEVRSEVQSATNGGQRPWVAENLDADFYFVPAPSQPPPPPPQVALQTPNQPTRGLSLPGPIPEPGSPEIVFWQTIENSRNPADYQAYIQQFPRGIFVPLARVRLASFSLQPPVQQPTITQQRPVQTPNGDETSWSDADRRAVQSALTALGDYQGPINGNFGPSMRPPILHWQAFEGLDPTGTLTPQQRDRILREADLQATLLKVGTKSPRGTPAGNVKGAEARFNRGVAFEHGTGQPKDPAEAAYWYALAATDDWPVAYTNLGTLYVHGQGKAQNVEAARRLWLTAAALGDGTAMFNLGALAETGFGGQLTDLAAAKRWYSRGAENRHADSAAALQRLGG